MVGTHGDNVRAVSIAERYVLIAGHTPGCVSNIRNGVRAEPSQGPRTPAENPPIREKRARRIHSTRYRNYWNGTLAKGYVGKIDNFAQSGADIVGIVIPNLPFVSPAPAKVST